MPFHHALLAAGAHPDIVSSIFQQRHLFWRQLRHREADECVVIVEQELEALVLQRLCRVAGAPPHAENTGWSQRHIELPDGAVANAEMMWKRIGKEETLSMEFFTEKGTRRVLTRENLFELKEAGWDAQSLIKHINGEKKTWPLE